MLSYVCKKCGSANVYVDAYAHWDYANQIWVLSSVQDQAYCEQCDNECELVTKEGE